MRSTNFLNRESLVGTKELYTGQIVELCADTRYVAGQLDTTNAIRPQINSTGKMQRTFQPRLKDTRKQLQILNWCDLFPGKFKHEDNASS